MLFQLTRPVRGEPSIIIDELGNSTNFNSLAPCGANRPSSTSTTKGGSISTHSPRAGRTGGFRAYGQRQRHFNSLAPCGANLGRLGRRSDTLSISTHSPRAGRTAVFLYARARERIFQLTRPVRGEPAVLRSMTTIRLISTHSPRAGRTVRLIVNASQLGHFNSLAPCGANQVAPLRCRDVDKFQLTRPVRGEPGRQTGMHVHIDISTHSPRAGRTQIAYREPYL